MKVDIFDLQGQPKGKIDLPKVFQEPVREDLIARAFIATMNKKRQPYGVDTMAGKRTSAHYHGLRHHRWTMMSREMARMPRTHGKVSPQQMWRPRFAPQTVGGRQAHPPIVEKVWEEKINRKERQKAIRSAIAATAAKEFVLKRGHKFEKDLPIVVEDEIQTISKTKELLALLEKIGLEKELERTGKRKIRAGIGKLRGRKYRKRKGPLLVVKEDKGVSKAVKNIPGMDICRVENLSAEYLAPGAIPGRLTIWAKSSIEKLGG